MKKLALEKFGGAWYQAFVLVLNISLLISMPIWGGFFMLFIFGSEMKTNWESAGREVFSGKRSIFKM